MMSKHDRRILGDFTRRLRLRFPDARVWAFGSRARGEAPLDSDFDICIVLDHVDREKDKWIRKTAWEISFENECVITTIVLDSEQFEHGPMSESTLVANILSEGVAA